MKREELSDLAVFLAVAEARSFTRAATKLGTSQSAISQIVKRLEAGMGIKLLTRNTRNVAPTEAGEQLIATLRPAFDDIDARLAELSALRERPAGTVRITSSRHAAEAILWPAVSGLIAAYPDVTVEISVDSHLTDIIGDRFDAFHLAPFAMTSHARVLAHFFKDSEIEFRYAPKYEKHSQNFYIYCCSFHLFSRFKFSSLPSLRIKQYWVLCKALAPDRIFQSTILLQQPAYLHLLHLHCSTIFSIRLHLFFRCIQVPSQTNHR